MLTLFSKPVFRLSVVILVNENILRVTPLVSKEINQRKYARWTARKPSKAFTSEEISSGSLDTEEFYKSDYSESESLKKESHKRDSFRKRDDNVREKTSREYHRPEHDYSDDESFEKNSHKQDTLRKHGDKMHRRTPEEYRRTEYNYPDNENFEKKSHKRANLRNRDDYVHGKIPEEYQRPDYDYSDDEGVERKSHKRGDKKTRYDNQPKKKLRSSGGLDYEVLDENDYTFSKMMLRVGNRNMRKKNGLIMLEGKRLILDAIEAGLQPNKIFFTKESFLDELNLPSDSNVPLFKLPYATHKLWSKLEAPPGVVGFYPIPKAADIRTVHNVPVKVVCDNVRDPGNMGSIIRVAAGVGCQEILLLKGCTDPWDSKVLRSGSGGHFHIPIQMDLLWDELDHFLNPLDIVFLADSRAHRTPPFNRDLPQNLYHEVNYVPANSVVVVIGGETEGLSSEAFKLASRYNGSRVNIPLSNCVESLNSGCALSVILFEIKKQIMLSEKAEKVRNAHHCTDRMKSVQNEEENVEGKRSSESGG